MNPALKRRWAEISPLLDEVLDLDALARAQRLEELGRGDPALAGAVQALLAEATAVDRGAFLEARVRRPGPHAGLAIGAYTLEHELGRGGMGSVWLARRADGRYDGRVAVKFLDPALTSFGGAQRFQREGRILARLSHPHIARLLDAGVAHGGQPYLVLEYVDGLPIDRYCEERGLDTRARVRLFLHVLAAVAHAHNRLILHRDVKPGNILVTAAGDVKLLDFGIAKLMGDAAPAAEATELTRLAGRPLTPAYAAPEQVEGCEVTTAADVYALGVLLFMLLSHGLHPTDPAGTASTPFERLRAVVEREPRRLSDAVAREVSAKAARELRGDLDNIVAKALKKSPAGRYATVDAFEKDLRRYLNDEPVLARPDAAAYRLGKFVRRHRVGVGAGVALMLTLATGVGVSLRQAQETQRQRVQAEGLIEFMLGDLRKRLQPVGRLDVLDAVGARVLAYYGGQDVDGLDADALGRRARALHLTGQIAESRGHLREAHDVFQRAAESTGRLLARHPHDGQRIFDHAQSMYWVGYVAWRRGRAQEAEGHFTRYRDLALRLARIDPGNLDWRAEPAYAALNLGVLHLEASRPRDAWASFLESRQVFDTLATLRPDFAYDLAEALGWTAKAHEAMGQYGAGIEAQQAKIDALGMLPDVERNLDAQRLLGNAAYELGRLQLCLGDIAAAVRWGAEAVSRFAVLHERDRSNLDWLAQLGAARNALTEALLARGDRPAARDMLNRASADIARLTAAEPSQVKWRVAFAGRALLLRAGLARLEREAPPVGDLRGFLVSVASLERAGSRLDIEQNRVVAAVEMTLGDAQERDGEGREARTHWRASAARLSAAAGAGDPAAITLLALAHARLGDLRAAHAWADRVEASTYRHPAYAELRQQLTREAARVDLMKG